MIITIGREHGSNGHDIARELARQLDYQCYDKEIVDHAAEQSGFSKEILSSYDERKVSNYVVATPHYLGMSEGFRLNMQITSAQFDTIRSIAEGGNAIFVGRCADYILRDEPNHISVFIRGETKDKAQRCIKEYGLGPNLAQGEMLRRDKERADYYNHYTGRTWGNAENYDICLNSSLFGVEGCADMIISAIKELQNK